MNSTNNDFYKNAAIKVFAQLGQLIEEDENITNKIDDKPIKSNKLDLNNDVLDKNNACLTIPICINIKDEEVEISKTLDKNSIIKIISKYNKGLSSKINKMDICKIEHPKTKNAYKSSIAQLTKAFDSNEKYFNDKFKKYYKYKQDMVNIVLCHSLKCLWISIYHGYSIEEDENKPKQINVLDSSTDILKDDKPIPVNLLDLSTDILNTIGDFVKKDNKEREERERERKDNIKREREEIVNSEQIINGKKNYIFYFLWQLPGNTIKYKRSYQRMHF